MKYGPNTSLVDEVVVAMSPDRIVEGIVDGQIRFDTSDRRFETIDDAKQAILLATTDDLMSDGYDNWLDIRNLAASKVLFPTKPISPNHTEVVRHFEALANRLDSDVKGILGPRIHDTLPGPYKLNFVQVLTQIYCDFKHICLGRLQYGIGYEPFETMFAAYKQGGWPSGWRGEYPDGRMVVYHVGPKA